jgi:hypothetical protein
MGTEALATILRKAKQAAGIGRPSAIHTLLGHNVADRIASFVEDMRSYGVKIAVTLTEDEYELKMGGKLPRR